MRAGPQSVFQKTNKMGGAVKQLQIAVAVFVSILAACGGAPVDVDGRSSESSEPLLTGGTELLDEGIEPMGTFEAPEVELGAISRMVLMADGTAHLEIASNCPGAPLPCEQSTIDGFYKRVEDFMGGHLYFVDEQDTVVYAADYQYDGKKLALLPERDTEWQALGRAPAAWCSVATHCEQQWLPQPLCPGQWACIDNGCQFQCSERPLDLNP